MTAATRRATIYWLALAAMTALLAHPVRACCAAASARAIQAIRDNEDAAASVGVRVVAHQAAAVRARRLRHRHCRRAVARDRHHLPAEDLLQRAVDRLHDLHGAGRRHRPLRGRDPRRHHLLPDRDLVRRHRRLVPDRARRHRAASSRCFCRAACGARSSSAGICACCRSATGWCWLAEQARGRARRQPSRRMQPRGSNAHDHASRQDDPDHRRRLGHRRAHRRACRPARRRRDRRRYARAGGARRHLRQGRHLDQGGRRRAGRDACRSRFDALCNVAGLSGKTGAAPTLAVNFYGLRALSEAMAPQAARGRRHRQRRLDRRLRLARQSQPRRVDGRHRGLSRCRQGRRRPRRQERGRLSGLQGAAAAVDVPRRAPAAVQGAAASASTR